MQKLGGAVYCGPLAWLFLPNKVIWCLITLCFCYFGIKISLDENDDCFECDEGSSIYTLA
jgi:hypothetical protein